jgi:hypothetical protein
MRIGFANQSFFRDNILFDRGIDVDTELGNTYSRYDRCEGNSQRFGRSSGKDGGYKMEGSARAETII